MRSLSLMTAWLVLTAAGAEPCLHESRADGATQALADLVVTGGERPVRIRLVVTHDGRPWRGHFDAAHGRHLSALFAQLDADGDGRLSAGEAKRLPPPHLLGAPGEQDGVFVAFNFRVLDDDGDGGAALDELGRYIGGFGGSPVTLSAIGPDPSRAGGSDLFALLDSDRNGRLTPNEWNAAVRLRDRDRDGNRVLDDAELRPHTAAIFGPEFVAAPWGGKEVTLSFDLQPPATDAPDATVLVRFADGPASGSTCEVTLGESAKDAGLTVSLDERGEPTLALGRHRIALRLHPSAHRREAQLRQAQLRQALLREFDAVAERAGGHVTAAAELPPRIRATFPVADGNADGRLDRKEIRHCVETLVAARQAAEASRLRVTVVGPRSGLFGLVDRNFDGRLSLRELQALAARMESVAGGPNDIGRDELPTTIPLLLQRGPFDESESAAMFLDAGPPWHYRADRNRDGDLDRGEFLGPPELFDRLDVNGDGWVDVHEAIRADHEFTTAAKGEVSP